MKSYNWGIIGNQKISHFLQKSLDNNKLSHAYLLSGSAHLGKSLMAEKFIASILCTDYQRQNQAEIKAVPCQQCIFCTQLAKGIHPDVYFLKKEEEQKNISVEQVREMQKFLYLTSFLNSYKVALINNSEELSESAQNALLKVLEEPRSKTILILICRDYNLLLPTIISRCQVLKFLPLSTEDIFQYLLKIGANREQARIYSAISHGQIGSAVNFFNNPDSFNFYLEQTRQLISLLEDNLASKFKTLENWLVDFATPIEKIEFLNSQLTAWQILLRDILFLQHNAGHLISNLHFQKKLEDLAPRYKTAKVLALLKQIVQVKQILIYNINPRLAVENLVLNF
jgi:DNA polymerase-3 subunit delta'